VERLTTDAVSGLARWSTSVIVQGDRLDLTLQTAAAVPDVLRYLVSAGADVHEVSPRRRSLEDLFLKIVGEDRGL
jgi:hypothetical protein